MHFSYIALDTAVVSKHGAAQVLDKSKSNYIETDVMFFDSQLNGIVFMITKTLGYMPSIYPEPQTRELRDVLDKLKTTQTSGGLLVDTVGLGKTITVAGFLAHMMKFVSEESSVPWKCLALQILGLSVVVLEQYLENSFRQYN